MTTPAPSTRNVTRAYRAASPEDHEHGEGWYRRARKVAAELDPYDPDRAAAVLAVLSPRASWPMNVRLAKQAYLMWALRAEESTPGSLAGYLPCLKGNALKAFRILAGEDPEDVVSGPKVRAFWLTIADPTDPRAVVIDRHAVDVACNRVLNDRTRGLILGRVGAYDKVAECYRRAARILGDEYGRVLTPAEVQATTWHYWRKNHAVANHGDHTEG